MDKVAIKTFAIWARTKLIESVTLKAQEFGFSPNGAVDKNADSINGKVLSELQKAQRRSLAAKINRSGFQQTIEEVAYAWFNRFIALRFMEVNGYLPTRIRVFSNEKVGA